MLVLAFLIIPAASAAPKGKGEATRRPDTLPCPQALRPRRALAGRPLPLCSCWQLFPSHSHAFTHRHSQSVRLFAHSTAGNPRPQRWWEPAPNSSFNDKVVAAAAGSECGWRVGAAATADARSAPLDR